MTNLFQRMPDRFKKSLFLLFILWICDLNTAHAYLIKRVQHIEGTLRETDDRINLLLPDSVDPEKTFLLMTSETSKLHAPLAKDEFDPVGGEGPGLASCYLSDEHTVELSRARSDPNGDVVIKANIEVVEFSEGVKVQRGIASFDENTYEKVIEMETFDRGRSFPILNVRSEGWTMNVDEEGAFQTRFEDNSSLLILRKSRPLENTQAPISRVDVEWQVVEFLDDARVVSGETNLPHFIVNKEQYLHEEDSVSKENDAFLIFNTASDVGVDGREALGLVSGQISEDGKRINFERKSKGASSDESSSVSWYLVALHQPSAHIQRGSEVFDEDQNVLEIPIEKVDLSRAFPILSVAGGLPPEEEGADQTLSSFKIRAELTPQHHLKISRLLESSEKSLEARVNWTVVEFPMLKLLSPTGGEVWRVKERYPIEWHYAASGERGGQGEAGMHLIRIMFSTQSGNDNYPYQITAGIPIHIERYIWTIPERVERINSIGSRQRIKIEDTDIKDYNFDVSQEDFAIKGNLELTAPNGEETWYVGDVTRKITWDYVGDLGTLALYYDLEGGFGINPFPQRNLIAYNIPYALKEFVWEKIPDIRGRKIRIKISQESDPTIYDTSFNSFTILPSIEIVNPSETNRIWMTQTPVTISWIPHGTIKVFDLFYSLDGGRFWQIIKQDEPCEFRGDVPCAYSWNIPRTDFGEDVKIKIQESGNPEITTKSPVGANLLKIKPWILITSPETAKPLWRFGETMPVAWEHDPSVSNVSIDFSADGGKKWKTLDRIPALTSPYPWSIPNLTTDQAVLRVYAAEKPEHYSDSKLFLLRGELKIRVPNGNEFWVAGSRQKIKWQKPPGVESVNLFYSTNGGLSFPAKAKIAEQVKANSFDWEVPRGLNTDKVKIRVAMAEDPDSYDDSDQNFWVHD